jgi:glucuronoarabinoxylan endo-1,4-beta-xylanase
MNPLRCLRFWRLGLGLVFSAASAAAQTTVTQVVDKFDPAGIGTNSYSGGNIGSVWSKWFGAAFQSLSWDSAVDADANAASGSLKIICNYPGSGDNQFTVINGFNGISPSINARQFTRFECDIKFAAGSATVLKNGVPTFGRLEFGMATPSFGQRYFGGVDVPASNTGWVRVSIPIDPTVDANYYKIANVIIHLYSGSLSGPSTLWVDNIKFTGELVNGTATVNYADNRQVIDGFGASSAWISSFSTTEADLLFSTGPGGAGLSLLRSRISPEGTSVETSIMKMARDRGARVWSTPWSPPPSLKTSNHYNGGSFISTPANYTTYANQLANYAATMKNSHGIDLHAISLQNEPDLETTYESCSWTAAQFKEFIPYVHSALAARGLSSIKIMLPEGQHWEFPLAVDTMADPATAAMVGILGGHNYGSSAAPVTQFGTPIPKPLWQTEHYFGTGSDIVNGLAVAEQIHAFMTVAEVNAYHYWWLKNSGTGSILGNSAATPAKRLYVMGNYSKFVRPGHRRVGMTTDTTALITAYKDPANLNYVIVAANPTAWPITQTFNLTSCPVVTSLDRYVTSATLSLASQAAVAVTGNTFTAELPAYSVTTYLASPSGYAIVPLTASDAFGASSFNAKLNWNDTLAPLATKDYTTGNYTLRTPTTSGNFTFGGHSLSIPAGGQLLLKGGNNTTTTIASLTLDGGSISNGNANAVYAIAGTLSVTADSSLSLSNDATRTLTVASDISGTGGLLIGAGGPGTAVLTGTNDAYTGAVTVNGGAVLRIAAQSNLGGPPAAFNAAQLSLANGTVEPTANLTLDRANSGVTLGTGGGAFLVNTGLALTISNPVSGNGTLTKSGNGTLALAGNATYSGNTTVSAGSLIVAGLGGLGGVNVASGAIFGGSGTVAGNTTVSGTLAPTPVGLTFSRTLSLASTSKLQCELTGNSFATADRALAANVTVASGAKLDLVLNGAGSTLNFVHSFWRSTRTFPVLAATSQTGALALGTVTADSAGHAVATYGAFTLQNSATGVNLIWTPVAGFPSVDDPGVTFTQPLVTSISLTSSSLSLRLIANSTGGPTTTLLWSQVSGPGIATFVNPAAADTRVVFSAEGSYVLRCTVANELGSVTRDLTVFVGPKQTLTLRGGENEYSHAATFIRADTTTWNSGARDQMLVGRFNGALRTLFSFPVPALPEGAALRSVSLDLWGYGAGTGTALNTLELRRLHTPFIEGMGDGSSGANGAGTGADWLTSTGNVANPWASAGGASGTDFTATPLTTLAGFNPSAAVAGTRYTFVSTPALLAAAAEVAGTAEPLDFMLAVTGDTAGNNAFARFISDDHSTIAQRPLLTLDYVVNELPALTAGVAPSAVTGVAATLSGSVTNATSSAWSLVSGPGSVLFANAAQPVTTATFTLPGAYLLRLSGSNAFGESSVTLAVSVVQGAPSFAGWRADNFTIGELADPEISGPDAIPAGDGISNLLKYALGLPPKTPATTGITLTKPAAAWLFTFQRPSNRPDIVYSVEACTDLATGSWSTSGVTLQRIATGEPETWQASFPSGASALFLRLRVTMQ